MVARLKLDTTREKLTRSRQIGSTFLFLWVAEHGRFLLIKCLDSSERLRV